MKKNILLILVAGVMLITPVHVNAANNKDEVTLAKCVDGDTARFNINGEVKSTRFIAIDTPESVHPKKKVEPYGKEASNYTCNKLKNANKIVLEYDENSLLVKKWYAKGQEIEESRNIENNSVFKNLIIENISPNI